MYEPMHPWLVFGFGFMGTGIGLVCLAITATLIKEMAFGGNYGPPEEPEENESNRRDT